MINYFSVRTVKNEIPTVANIPTYIPVTVILCNFIFMVP